MAVRRRPLWLLPALLLAAGLAAGCRHLAPGTIAESSSSLGDLVWVGRQVPVFGLGMPGCFLRVEGARGGEFRWGGAPYVLVELGVHNGAPHRLAAVTVEVLTFDLAGSPVSRETGDVPLDLMTGQRGEARWTNRLPRPDAVVRVSARLVRARAANGMECGVVAGPATSPPPPPFAVAPPSPAPTPDSRPAPAPAPVPEPAPAPPPAAEPEPDPQTFPEDPVLRFGQHRLNQQGYACGEPSGYMDETTRRCIRAFQRAEGLPETGQLDDATWQRLDQLSVESEALDPGEGWQE